MFLRSWWQICVVTTWITDRFQVEKFFVLVKVLCKTYFTDLVTLQLKLLFIRIFRSLCTKFEERYHLSKSFAKYLNSHLGVENPHTFKAKIKHLKWICGYLGIPLATNVASEEILLNTTVLHNLVTGPFWRSQLPPLLIPIASKITRTLKLRQLNCVSLHLFTLNIRMPTLSFVFVVTIVV